MPDLRSALEYLDKVDEEYRLENGLHPSNSPALGMSPTAWNRWRRKRLDPDFVTAETPRLLALRDREPGDDDAP